MKTCKQCLLDRDEADFFHRKASKDGLDYICKPCKRQNDREWSKQNRTKKTAYDKSWKEANKEHVRKYFANYRRLQRQANPLEKLKDNLSKRIRKALNGLSKSASTVALLGTSIKEVCRHLESKFQSGMTWENYGQWHVDHIIPLASAKNSDEMIALFHYKNLQPLWALDNIRKSDKHEGNQ